MRRLKLHLGTPDRLATGLIALCAIMPAPALTQSAAGAGTTPAAAASTQQPIVLDSVIAVINGDVLLRSDLQSEMDMAALQPASLPSGKNFERRAAQRLINRILILQQMKSQGMAKEASSEDVQKDLDELRKQLPACLQYH